MSTDDDRNTDVGGSELDGVLCQNLSNEDKKMILHAAYLAYAYRQSIFKMLDIVTSDGEKLEIIGKIPCGDPTGNLLRLACACLPDFNRHAPIKDEFEKVKKFLYGA